MNKDKVIFILLNVLVFILIAGIVFGIVAFADILIKKPPPRVAFLDETEQNNLAGKIYLDEEEVGSTGPVIYDFLPDKYCDRKYQLRLETNSLNLTWLTSPTDCLVTFISYKMKTTGYYLAYETATFRFIDKEEMRYISGNLYLDGEYKGLVVANYTLSAGDCREVDEIIVQSFRGLGSITSVWENNKSLCGTQPVIDLYIVNRTVEEAN